MQAMAKQKSGAGQQGTTQPEAPAESVRHLAQKDLARRWTCSTRTVERWRVRGEGPPFLKIGGRVVYRLSDVHAFEAARLRASTKQRP
jgi:hypothetical protein